MTSDRSALTAPPSHLHNKVFGVGLARTGTTSLHEAMLLLGLRSAPDSIPLLDAVDVDFLARHDAFFDNPVPFRYQVLDKMCPDSCWIVTQRPVDDWLASMEWLFGPGIDRLPSDLRRVGDQVHRNVYGSDRFDEVRLRGIYEHHYAELGDWLGDRPSVWIHVEQGLEWKPICDLLGLPIPPQDFPHTNQRTKRRFGRRRSRS